MRTFTPNLAADLARTDGSGPVWLLRFTAAGTDYILCQDAINIPPWGKAALPWIASWGQLTEGVTSTLSDFNISSLSVNMINDPNATPNLRSLAKARVLNGLAVSVYIWVDGCIDEPFEMFSFMIIDIDLPDEASVNIEMQDESARHENSSPGTIITKEDHPSADPDDVGKIIPMPFGTVSKLTAVALDSGRITSIPNAISATAVSFSVSDATGLSSGMALKIDDEIIGLVSVAGDVLTVTRGTLGTLATTHQRGASAWELKDEFIYAVSDFPVTSMPKAYGRVGQAIMDISGLCTVWPAGNHPNYPGKAVVSVPGYITAAQAVDMLVNDGIDIEDRLAIENALSVSDTITVNDLIGISDGVTVNDPGHYNPISGLTITESTTTAPGTSSEANVGTNGSVSVYATFNNTAPGNRAAITLTVNVIFKASYTYNWYFFLCDDAGTNVVQIAAGTGATNPNPKNYTFEVPTAYLHLNKVRAVISSSNIWVGVELQGATRSIRQTTVNSGVRAAGVYRAGAVTKTNTVTKLGTATLAGTLTRTAENSVKTGTVTLSGNSVANTLIGDAILVDVISPITEPQEVITKILGTPCNLIGTFPAGYAFNGAITSSRRAPEWCHELARQCRSYFKWVLGQPTLIVRPDVLTPVKSIDEIRLSNGVMSHGQRQTGINDVINTINLRYDRDWSSTSSGDEVYRQVAKDLTPAARAESITAYGIRERPELFRCDFVTDTAMAESLVEFYLAWYAWQRWQHTQECYL
ncbi:MAG: hypothetical protein PHH91_14600, partial [Desulfuromonadaceae bacterium]|nr:hypothetical protein [Desulfuromonadaceae bacterium]